MKRKKGPLSSKFKPGQAIVYEPSWADQKKPGGRVYKNHPLRYGDIVSYLADHSPAYGHCIVTTYEGKVITMLHPEDFRKATDDEV